MNRCFLSAKRWLYSQCSGGKDGYIAIFPGGKMARGKMALEHRHYHQICHKLNIDWMNSVDVFVTVKSHRKHYRSCVTHLRTSGTIFLKP